VAQINNNGFAEIIRKAVAGDRNAVEQIILRYKKLINRRSVIDGKIDEDLRQYIIMYVIEKLPSFKPR